MTARTQMRVLFGPRGDASFTNGRETLGPPPRPARPRGEGERGHRPGANPADVRPPGHSTVQTGQRGYPLEELDQNPVAEHEHGRERHDADEVEEENERVDAGLGPENP